MYEVLECIFLL